MVHQVPLPLLPRRKADAEKIRNRIRKAAPKFGVDIESDRES